MLNLQELRPRPDLTREMFGRAQDKEVKEYLTNGMECFLGKMQNKYRLSRVASQQLLFIDGSAQESILPTEFGKLWVERDRLQELGIGVMKEYGLNPDGILLSSSRSRLNQPIGIERISFASEKIQNLSFERKVEFITQTNEPINLRWFATDLSPDSWWERVLRK